MKCPNCKSKIKHNTSCICGYYSDSLIIVKNTKLLLNNPITTFKTMDKTISPIFGFSSAANAIPSIGMSIIIGIPLIIFLLSISLKETISYGLLILAFIFLIIVFFTIRYNIMQLKNPRILYLYGNKAIVSFENKLITFNYNQFTSFSYEKVGILTFSDGKDELKIIKNIPIETEYAIKSSFEVHN